MNIFKILLIVMVIASPAFAHTDRPIAVITDIVPKDADTVEFRVKTTTGSYLILDDVRVAVSSLATTSEINDDIKAAVVREIKRDTPSLNYRKEDVVLASSLA